MKNSQKIYKNNKNIIFPKKKFNFCLTHINNQLKINTANKFLVTYIFNKKQIRIRKVEPYKVDRIVVELVQFQDKQRTVFYCSLWIHE